MNAFSPSHLASCEATLCRWIILTCDHMKRSFSAYNLQIEAVCIACALVLAKSIFFQFQRDDIEASAGRL